MKEPVRLSRLARRRAHEALQPPRPLWRLVGTAPVLAVALVFLVQVSLAWFTDTTLVTGTIMSSGTWHSLIDGTPSSLEASPTYDTDYVAIPPGATDTTRSFTLTTEMTEPVSLSYEWIEEDGPTPDVSIPSTIDADHPAVVIVSGTGTADFNGKLRLYLGDGRFDESPEVTVNVSVQPIPINRLSDPDLVGGCLYKSGTAAPKFSWLHVLNVTKKGDHNVPMTVSVEQVSEEPTRTVYVWANDGNNPPPTDPDESELSTSYDFTLKSTSKPVKIQLFQERTRNDYPTYVKITLTPRVWWASGSQTFIIVMGHSDDINHLPDECPEDLPPPFPDLKRGKGGDRGDSWTGEDGTGNGSPDSTPSGEAEGPEPEGTEPEGTESEGTEPEGTEPEGTGLEGTESEGTEPEGTEPEGTEPEGTEPEGTESEEAGSQESESEEIFFPEVVAP